MTFPAQHQYVSVIGDAFSSTENWQFGFRITDGGISNAATAAALGPILLAWWNGTGAYASNFLMQPPATHRLTEIKVARIGTDGLYPPTEASASYFYPTPIVGGTAASQWQVPQGTVAVTLRTALPRGLASKGRLYLPPSVGYQIAADGRMSVLAADKYAGMVRILVNEINAATLIGNVAVFSPGKAVRGPDKPNGKPTYTYPGLGAMQNVTGVSCGRVVDTQRRRRRQLAENPSAVAL